MKLKPIPFLGVLTLPLLLYSCAVTKPVAPTATAVDVPKIEQPVSVVDVPVTVDLKSYFVQAENSVPNKYSDNQQPCEGLRYQYVFTRTPFAITGSNNVVNLSFVGSYGFTVSYCAKCATFPGSGETPIIAGDIGAMRLGATKHRAGCRYPISPLSPLHLIFT